MSTKPDLKDEALAILFTIPSFLVICAYSYVFTRFGMDGVSSYPTLIFGGPFTVIFSIGAIPIIFRSRHSKATSALLYGSHFIGDILALLPLWGILALFIFVRGPINPG